MVCRVFSAASVKNKYGPLQAYSQDPCLGKVCGKRSFDAQCQPPKARALVADVHQQDGDSGSGHPTHASLSLPRL